jgi:SAM-dependent methyltransferase
LLQKRVGPGGEGVRRGLGDCERWGWREVAGAPGWRGRRGGLRFRGGGPHCAGHFEECRWDSEEPAQEVVALARVVEGGGAIRAGLRSVNQGGREPRPERERASSHETREASHAASLVRSHVRLSERLSALCCSAIATGTMACSERTLAGVGVRLFTGAVRHSTSSTATIRFVLDDLYAVDAQFYDAIHGDYRDDIGLWLSFAGRTDRPVLEVGCGTGRIALALARGGYTVTGIEPSLAMLGIARQRAEADALDVTFIEGRPLDLTLEPEHYGLVLLGLDVFLYCEDGEEQAATLRSLRDALVFNGLLVLDLPGPAQGLDPDSNGRQVLVFSGETAEAMPFDCYHLHEDDLAAQVRHLRITYETTTKDGLVRRQVSEHLLRYVYRFELEYLLDRAGLALADVYGDYDLGPLTNDSERMLAIVRRRDG